MRGRCVGVDLISLCKDEHFQRWKCWNGNAKPSQVSEKANGAPNCPCEDMSALLCCHRFSFSSCGNSVDSFGESTVHHKAIESLQLGAFSSQSVVRLLCSDWALCSLLQVSCHWKLRWSFEIPTLRFRWLLSAYFSADPFLVPNHTGLDLVAFLPW